jgi:hypothetical protein
MQVLSHIAASVPIEQLNSEVPHFEIRPKNDMSFCAKQLHEKNKFHPMLRIAFPISPLHALHFGRLTETVPSPFPSLGN